MRKPCASCKITAEKNETRNKKYVKILAARGGLHVCMPQGQQPRSVACTWSVAQPTDSTPQKQQNIVAAGTDRCTPCRGAVVLLLVLKTAD